MTLQHARSLSRHLAAACDLRAGTFEWSFEPYIDAEGSWWMSGAPEPLAAVGIRPLVFFRGPSYDGLVVWTAPGREGPARD